MACTQSTKSVLSQYLKHKTHFVAFRRGKDFSVNPLCHVPCMCLPSFAYDGVWLSHFFQSYLVVQSAPRCLRFVMKSNESIDLDQRFFQKQQTETGILKSCPKMTTNMIGLFFLYSFLQDWPPDKRRRRKVPRLRQRLKPTIILINVIL